MTTNHPSPLDRALAAVHPRRAVTALAAGLASLVLLRTADVDPDPDAVARRRRRRKPISQVTCGDIPQRNKCKKSRDCCSGLCDKKKKRCTYRESGQPCANDAQCLPPLRCASGVCAPQDSATSTPTATATSSSEPTETPTPVPTETPTPVPDGWTYSTQFGSLGSSNANFSLPFCVTVSADTLTAWVADFNNDRISIWTRPNDSSSVWNFGTKFGSYGTGDSSFKNPSCVAVSSDSLTAWVADKNNSRIVAWTRQDANSTDWSYSTQFGSDGPEDDNFSRPIGLAVSADTLTAWVADTYNHRISVWARQDTSSAWGYSTQFGSEGWGDSQFTYPASVAVSADTLTTYVLDQGNDRVSIWTRPNDTSTSWTFSTKFGTTGSGDGNLSYPYGLAISGDGLSALVADSNNSRISVWARPDGGSTAWAYSTSFGSAGPSNNQFSYPDGVALSADGLTAWVADSGNNRIVVWKYA